MQQFAYAHDWKEQLPTAVGVPDHPKADLCLAVREALVIPAGDGAEFDGVSATGAQERLG